jgi:Holliday junction DNA helicase RuvA
MSADEFTLCVQAEDAAALTRLPGVGKKTAERLIVEMRDALKDWQGGGATSPATATGMTQAGDAVADAVSALVALGYKPPEASRMVRSIDTTELSSEEIIRLALQGVAKQA